MEKKKKEDFIFYSFIEIHKRTIANTDITWNNI